MSSPSTEAFPLQRAAGQRALERAADSIAAASGLPGTVVDVVHGRALRPYREGLRQYLAIRLGDVEEAEAALEELRALVTGEGAQELARPPGIRARLYRHARRIAWRRRGADGPPPASQRAKLPWRPPRPGSLTADLRLEPMRTDLADGDAELLELRHARELGPQEIAFVVDRPVERVLEELESATQAARELLPRRSGEETHLRHVLLQAFALELAPRPTAVAGDQAGVEPLAPETLVGGRYAIERRVGKGAFGDVYRARDAEVPGHVVALKLLHQPAVSEEARGRALRELQLIASVFHPSVVQFKDHGWHEGRLWFVMPWYEGETLEARIRRKRLSRADARRIFEPLARALATMHAAGIRHQDVKPDNIFLARIPGFGRDGEEEVLPVLIDLGVAAKEAEMVIAGTPTYFAPEAAAQFASETEARTVTSKADVFALALSLRNALEPDTQPDVPAGAVETFIEERSRDAPPPPAAREFRYLQPCFERWLSLDPDERPDADALAEELAVLTRPEERRHRRNAMLRWLVPSAITLATLFASVVYVLDTRAEQRKLEAHKARMAEARVRKDLQDSRQQRRSLERDVRKVHQRYERSRLTRRQLASQLAQSEQTLRQTRADLRRGKRRRHALREDLEAQRHELDEAQGRIDTLDQELASARDALATARSRASSLDAEVGRLESALADARARARRSSRRLAQLEGDLERTRSRLEAERTKSSQLERRIGDVIQSRASAERELDQARERIDTLERRLETTKDDEEAPPAGAESEEPRAKESRDPSLG